MPKHCDPYDDIEYVPPGAQQIPVKKMAETETKKSDFGNEILKKLQSMHEVRKQLHHVIAKDLWDLMQAYKQAGFAEEQAFRLVLKEKTNPARTNQT